MVFYRASPGDCTLSFRFLSSYKEKEYDSFFNFVFAIIFLLLQEVLTLFDITFVLIRPLLWPIVRKC